MPRDGTPPWNWAYQVPTAYLSSPGQPVNKSASLITIVRFPIARIAEAPRADVPKPALHYNILEFFKKFLVHSGKQVTAGFLPQKPSARKTRFEFRGISNI
jgi:hypothetical protein